MVAEQDRRRRLLGVLRDLAADGGSVALLPHERFDADAIGAAISLAQVLTAIGCVATVMVDEAPPASMSHLPLLDIVKIYEPDASCAPFDFALAVDCHEADRLGARAACFSLSRLRGSVDHHVFSDEPGELDLIVPTASSTCELVYDIIQDLETLVARQLFDSRIATLLLAGMITDTGRYAYSNTTPACLRQAASLLERFSVDLSRLHYHLYERTSVGRLQIKGDILASIVPVEDGRILTAHVTRDALNRRGVTDDDLAYFASDIRAAEGNEVVFLFVETDDRQGVRINIRSNGCFDAAAFARRFGGGGHLRAAGMTLRNTPLEQAVDMIVREAKTTLRACLGEKTS